MSRRLTVPEQGEEVAVLVRRNRVTGTETAVEYHPGEDEGTRWNSVCYEHGTLVGHETRKLATDWMAAPWYWCEFCREHPAVVERGLLEQ